MTRSGRFRVRSLGARPVRSAGRGARALEHADAPATRPVGGVPRGAGRPGHLADQPGVPEQAAVGRPDLAVLLGAQQRQRGVAERRTVRRPRSLAARAAARASRSPASADTGGANTQARAVVPSPATYSQPNSWPTSSTPSATSTGSPLSHDRESSGAPPSAASTWRGSSAAQNGPRVTDTEPVSNADSGVVRKAAAWAGAVVVAAEEDHAARRRSPRSRLPRRARARSRQTHAGESGRCARMPGMSAPREIHVAAAAQLEGALGLDALVGGAGLSPDRTADVRAAAGPLLGRPRVGRRRDPPRPGGRRGAAHPSGRGWRRRRTPSARRAAPARRAAAAHARTGSSSRGCSATPATPTGSPTT